ncbi:MAG: FAD-dependent oxidoreductase [Gemmatimonadales bacterium]|nr:FAD-dependent oxidoreductase [Gemmatimonadales bacterium]NIN10772.1 FAD-dependent oxidoreductase [Gemmatimonadales bacterium]NIQ99002.1 FAD-dependent oxidoreductase [Gemmatimonadales bacterium]NIS63821.1 FAD-dependent oxidoreductase [Gemmatimonadales bacterium]
MTHPGTAERPARVAIVGSGPAGFYTAEHLLARRGLSVQVDVYERLPTPFGLVRFGVAPDHAKIKSVTRVYDRVASKPGFRFFGNVEVGEHVTLEDLQRHYHQVCFATGAQTDRQMGIPGEDLQRSHTATEFVAWYNGHPDYRDRHFDLSVERVAVVGVGNVAVDVARILCRTPEELAQTDIADYALDALRGSRVREVYMLGRRGPAQAAFTNAEIKELGDLPAADLVVRSDEVELDPLSRRALEANPDRATSKKVEILQDLPKHHPAGKPRRLTIRFLVSPVELMGNEAGGVVGVRLVKNELYTSEDGSLRPTPTAVLEDLPVEMVFRSVGYRGVPIPGLPFDAKRGIVPNQMGRVTQHDTGEPMVGVYVSGWIKRGPTGVIGTNKPDAGETVRAMLEDLQQGTVLRPSQPDPAAVEWLVRERQPRSVSYEDWRCLDALEVERGRDQGRPRVKFTTVEEMLGAMRSKE